MACQFKVQPLGIAKVPELSFNNWFFTASGKCAANGLNEILCFETLASYTQPEYVWVRSIQPKLSSNYPSKPSLLFWKWSQ